MSRALDTSNGVGALHRAYRPERPTVAIDGEPAAMLSAYELNGSDFDFFARKGYRIDELLELAWLSADERAELPRLVREIALRVLFFAPAEVKARVSDRDCIRIVVSWSREVMKARGEYDAAGKRRLGWVAGRLIEAMHPAGFGGRG